MHDQGRVGGRPRGLRERGGRRHGRVTVWPEGSRPRRVRPRSRLREDAAGRPRDPRTCGPGPRPRQEVGVRPAESAASQDRARDTILRDGSPIRIRPARPTDEAGLVAFLQGLAVNRDASASRASPATSRRPPTTRRRRRGRGVLARRGGGRGREDRGERQLRPPGPGLGRGRVRRRRRLAGSRRRDAAPRGARATRAGRRDRDVRRRDPRGKRPDARRVPGERLPAAPPRRAGGDDRRVPHRAHRPGPRALRAPGADRRGGRGPRAPPPGVGRGHRASAGGARSAASCSTTCSWAGSRGPSTP